MIKRFVAIFLLIMVLMISVAIPAYAATAVNGQYSSMSLPYYYGTLQLTGVGFNPTFYINVSGGSSLTFDVWIINPLGVRSQVYTGLPANGNDIVISSYWLSGNYSIEVSAHSGHSSGNNYYLNVKPVW
jgi:hypothetical protein